MNTLFLISAFVACVVFLVIGIVIGRSLSKTMLLSLENQLKTQFDADKQKQVLEIQSFQQKLALKEQQNEQLEKSINNLKQDLQQNTTCLDNLRNLHTELSAKLSASLSTEQGLTIRLQERDNTIAVLNQEVVTLGKDKTNQQELIEQQKVQLGQAQAEKEQLSQLQGQLQHKDQYIQKLQSEATSYISTIKELKTAAEKDAQNMAEKLALLEDNKSQLKQEFENLAHQIFDNKQHNFSQQSQQGLNSLLNPFKEQLDAFRKRVDEVHANSIEGQTNIKAELEKLRELNTRINDEAANLTKALKSDKKLQGSWGEQKVDLLLERAGLRKDIEYTKEENFKNDAGKNQRPDFVINLPEGKHIIIDSKMSLVAYMDYVAADNDKARQEALNRHVKAIEHHINDLSDRKYHALQGLNTPDFVFLFMPIEPAYILIAEHAPAIFEKAYEKNIAIVTAANLLPVLRVVANLWSIQRQNRNTKELAEQAGRVYEKLCAFINKMEAIGSHLNKAQESYHESFNSLRDGKGSLTKIVSNFVDLGVKVSKQLPPSVLEDLSESNHQHQQ